MATRDDEVQDFIELPEEKPQMLDQHVGLVFPGLNQEINKPYYTTRTQLHSI